ncbi:MAG: chemotaxis protein CheX [Terriglobales bacterium]
MSTDMAFVRRAHHDEDWQPILELAIQEVFTIMLGTEVKPGMTLETRLKGEFTAMVGLAGALCGVLTLTCGAEAAHQIAKCMLGDAAESEDQVVDALGELCNMITGNFKNKLAGTDERCLLSVPSVVSGGEYNFRSLADGSTLETILMFEGAPVDVRLQLKS